MKKLTLKEFDLSFSKLSVEEKTKVLGGYDGPMCLCERGDSIPMVGDSCPCWCVPCYV